MLLINQSILIHTLLIAHRHTRTHGCRQSGLFVSVPMWYGWMIDEVCKEALQDKSKAQLCPVKTHRNTHALTSCEQQSFTAATWSVHIGFHGLGQFVTPPFYILCLWSASQGSLNWGTLGLRGFIKNQNSFYTLILTMHDETTTSQLKYSGSPLTEYHTDPVALRASLSCFSLQGWTRVHL